MNDNSNPYPKGRWTPNNDSISSAAHSQRVPLFLTPPSSLLRAPLRDLFWGLPESNLLDEARQRVERAIAASLAKTQTAMTAVQAELSLA